MRTERNKGTWDVWRMLDVYRENPRRVHSGDVEVVIHLLGDFEVCIGDIYEFHPSDTSRGSADEW